MSQSAVTPYRATTVTFQPPEPVAVAQPFAGVRNGPEMGRARPEGSPDNRAVAALTSGAWALLPLAHTQHLITEYSDTSSTLELIRWNTISYVAEHLVWRKSDDLPGVTYASTVANYGDQFMTRQMSASDTWDLGMNADAAAYGQPPHETANAKMLRIGVTKKEYPEDTGIYWRLRVPGTAAHSPDYLCTVYFGGPATSDGKGQFALSITGDGQAQLYERINSEWEIKDHWRFAEAQNVCGRVHMFRIMPHLSRGGRSGYIEFISGTLEAVGESGPPMLRGAYAVASAAPSKHLYSINFLPSDGRTSVTGKGPVRYDERIDQRCDHQFGILRYPVSGRLTDAAFQVSDTSPRTSIFLRWMANAPSGSALVGKLYDATTNAELTMISEGDQWREYRPNFRSTALYAVFEYESGGEDHEVTPLLWEYTVTKDGWVEVCNPGAFIGGNLRALSISGAERDITHSTASLRIDDLADDLATLRLRAAMPVEIATQYDPLDATKKSILFRGYLVRAEGLKKGKAGSTFPSEEWRSYQITLAGQWKRLYEAYGKRFNLGNDPEASALGAASVPYKVTDAVRAMLGWAGYPPDMVDVPDSPIRFFPGGDAKSLLIDPSVCIGEFVTSALKNYLGWHLAWCENSGTQGMWRAVPPPLAPYTPLAYFTTAGPGVAGRLVHRPESYGSTNWVGTALTAPTTFITKGGYKSYVKEPEANHITVSGYGAVLPDNSGHFQIALEKFNPASYNCFTDADGNTIETADPNNPDYIGHEKPMTIVDTTLAGESAVAWVLSKVFDVAAHGVKVIPFVAPLVLIVDPNDPYQTRPRPPRYYDALSVNGVPVLCRNCNPFLLRGKDAAQMATYEVELPNF